MRKLISAVVVTETEGESMLTNKVKPVKVRYGIEHVSTLGYRAIQERLWAQSHQQRAAFSQMAQDSEGGRKRFVSLDRWRKIMSKCVDREHHCVAIKGDDPRYHVVRSIASRERTWEIWIPDFLRSDDKSVKAFVWRIKYCPFCGSDLTDEKNSKEL